MINTVLRRLLDHACTSQLAVAALTNYNTAQHHPNRLVSFNSFVTTWDILNSCDARCNALTYWNNMDIIGECIMQAEVYYNWTGLTFEAASSWNSCSYFIGLSCFISASVFSLCFVLIQVARYYSGACSCSSIYSKFLIVTWKRAGVAGRMNCPRIRSNCDVCWLRKWSYIKWHSVQVLLMRQSY